MKSIRTAAVSILSVQKNSSIFSQDRIHEFIEQNRISEPDRQLLTHIVLGVIRHERLLDHLLSELSLKPAKLFIKQHLRVALYQAVFLDKVPEYAVVSETMKTADHFKMDKHQKNYIRWILGSFYKDQARFLPYPGRYYDSLPAEIRYSIPDWILKEWKKYFSESELKEVLQASLETPPVWIFSCDKTLPLEDLVKKCVEMKISYFRETAPDCLKLSNLPDFIRQLLRERKVFAQSPHQFNSINLCPAAKGESVLEIGSAPGTKTLTLAEKVGEKGSVVAVEKNHERFKELKDRVAVFSQVKPVECDFLHGLPDTFPQLFDHVVIDPPCSNLGELCRRPEVKWRLKEADIHSLSVIQIELAEKAWPYLKVSGTLLYITCSLIYEENEAIKNLLQEKTGCRVLSEIKSISKPGSPAGGYALLVQKV